MSFEIEDRNSLDKKFDKFAAVQAQKVPWMYKQLIKAKIASDEKQAEHFLIGLSIVFFLIAGYILSTSVFHVSFVPKKQVPIPPEIQKILDQAKAQRQQK